MDNRFKELLHLFQNDLADEDETGELMQMIESGIYDDQIGESWEYLLRDYFDNDKTSHEDAKAELELIQSRIPTEVGTDNAKVDTEKSHRSIYWITAVAAVGLLLVFITFWGTKKSVSDVTGRDVAIESLQEKIFEGKQFVQLPDGSTVFLNEGSQLKYTGGFGIELREVYLSGEAYFDVLHNPEAPFIVKAGNLETRVLGTAFNVKAWPEETEMQVTVTRGKVSVGDDEKVYEELVPDEQIVVNTETHEFRKQNLDAEKSIDWKDDFFVLDKVTMKEAALRISSRFGVAIEIQNDELRNCLVNGAFLNNENVEHVISVISLAMNAEYEIFNNKIVIMGGIGCK
ncbi:FecR family protein [Membranihabitans maritimus]|uniref:FecR family protein n=1 Tax=Membranihabitans maritimus TaxID=2904244 RepID=UPI001F2CE75F|nr:FecR domain-containing protein [Membranihabitans maritimus]